MQKTKLWLMLGLVVVLVAAFVLPGCVPEVAPPEEEEEEEEWPPGLTIGTSSLGSGYYIMLSGWGETLSKYTGVPTAAESTAGPAANIGLIETGEMELGAATNLVLWQAWNSVEGTWAEGEVFEKVRVILPCYPSVLQGLALKASGIESMYDYEGKRVVIGPAGTTPAILLPIIFDTLGISVTPVNLGWTDAHLALVDGIVDVVQRSTGYPTASIEETAHSHPLNFIGVSPEDVPKIQEVVPFMSEAVLPAGTYTGVDEDIPTLSMWGYLLASRDLPEDLVYEIVKATVDNIDEIIAIYPHAKNIVNLKMITGSTVPIHPGAIRYYKEVGIEIPENLYPPEYK